VNILLVHNFYLEAGGEDAVYRNEAALLESRGHRVFRFERDNHAVAGMGRLALAASTVWNRHSHRAIADLVRRERIDLVHIHNTLPLVSPAAYYAARAGGAAVVQTLHNYRLFCVNAKLYRDDAPCEKCLGRALPWPGVRHRCYRDSRAASAGVAAMLAVHRGLGTWAGRVDRYIALTEFARRTFVAGGIPEGLIAVKPNFVEAPVVPPAGGGGRRGFLFVGRLVAEKGVPELLRAANDTGISLRLAGAGPLEAQARERRCVVLGHLSKEKVYQEMRHAVALVAPSNWYETFGLVVVEAFANGLPAIVSRGGAMEEIVEDGVTGLLVAPGDAAGLAAKMAWAAARPEAMAEMGRNARHTYEARYTPERNYAMLMKIYEDAIRTRRSEGR